MPTTRPRKVRLGGVEVSLALDRALAQNIKANPLYRRLRRRPAPPPFHDQMPALDGTKLADIDWYQTIDLPNGVTTPGFIDQREQVKLYGLPDSLAGKRCLDAATADGFWAFEMEKRGAAEVTGIDLYSLLDFDVPRNFSYDYLRFLAAQPRGLGFAYAKRALRSRVRRRVMSVYELAPERIGTFDLVLMSGHLRHLRDPLAALEALRTVTRGEAIIADSYDRDLEAAGQENAMRFRVSLDGYDGCNWWSPSISALKAMISVARFTDVEQIAQFDLDTKLCVKVPMVVFRARGGRLW